MEKRNLTNLFQRGFEAPTNDPLVKTVEAAANSEFEARVASLNPELNAFNEAWRETDVVRQAFKSDADNQAKAREFVIESDKEIVAQEGLGFKGEILKPFSGLREGRSMRSALKWGIADLLNDTESLQNAIAKIQSWWPVFHPDLSKTLAYLDHDHLINQLDVYGESLAKESTRSGKVGYELYLEALKLRQQLADLYNVAYVNAHSVMDHAGNSFANQPDSARWLLEHLNRQTQTKTLTKEGRILAKLLAYEYTHKAEESVIGRSIKALAEAYRQSSFEDFFMSKVTSDDVYTFINKILSKQSDSPIDDMKEMEADWPQLIKTDFNTHVNRFHHQLNLQVTHLFSNFIDTKLDPPTFEDLAKYSKA